MFMPFYSPDSMTVLARNGAGEGQQFKTNKAKTKERVKTLKGQLLYLPIIGHKIGLL